MPVLFGYLTIGDPAIGLVNGPVADLHKLPHPVQHPKQRVPLGGNFLSRANGTLDISLVIVRLGPQLNGFRSFASRSSGLIWVHVGPFCGRSWDFAGSILTFA